MSRPLFLFFIIAVPDSSLLFHILQYSYHPWATQSAGDVETGTREVSEISTFYPIWVVLSGGYSGKLMGGMFRGITAISHTRLVA